MSKRIILLVWMLFSFFFMSQAQSVLGKWKTIDDHSGEAKSVVEIFKKNDRIYGKIIRIMDTDQQKSLCDKCKGSKKNKAVLGMVIIEGLSSKNETYSGGTILDPEKGKEYRCKIWVDRKDGNKLNVRGYIAFLFRTQEWFRVD